MLIYSSDCKTATSSTSRKTKERKRKKIFARARPRPRSADRSACPGRAFPPSPPSFTRKREIPNPRQQTVICVTDVLHLRPLGLANFSPQPASASDVGGRGRLCTFSSDVAYSPHQIRYSPRFHISTHTSRVQTMRSFLLLIFSDQHYAFLFFLA